MKKMKNYLLIMLSISFLISCQQTNNKPETSETKKLNSLELILMNNRPLIVDNQDNTDFSFKFKYYFDENQNFKLDWVSTDGKIIEKNVGQFGLKVNGIAFRSEQSIKEVELEYSLNVNAFHILDPFNFKYGDNLIKTYDESQNSIQIVRSLPIYDIVKESYYKNEVTISIWEMLINLNNSSAYFDTTMLDNDLLRYALPIQLQISMKITENNIKENLNMILNLVPVKNRDTERI